jgi:hypothetical protein
MRVNPNIKTKAKGTDADGPKNFRRTAAVIFVFIGVFYWFYKVIF